MHSHLYAQTGHFATPTEVAAFACLVILVILAGAAKSIFS